MGSAATVDEAAKAADAIKKSDRRIEDDEEGEGKVSERKWEERRMLFEA